MNDDDGDDAGADLGSEAAGDDRGDDDTAAGGELDDDDADPGAGDDDAGAGDDDAGAGGQPPSIGQAELLERLADLGGLLAVGNGPELAVVRPDGARIDVLDGSETVVASQPTWSRDGRRLAWASLSAAGQRVQVQDFGDDGERDGQPLSAEADGTPVFYLQWNEADDRLAYIRNAPDGRVVEVGMVEPGQAVEPLGQGAPFFISWSPAPDRLLGHVNELSIDAWDRSGPPDLGFVSVLPVRGGFSAPAWVDAGRAIVVAEGQLVYLDVATGLTEPIIDVGGPIRFVLSPDRSKLAYQRVGGAAGPSLAARTNGSAPAQADRSGLLVLDLATLEETVVTSQLAVAWEWRPDSGGLAWLEGEISAGRALGRWNFWALDGTPPATPRSAPFQISRKYGQAYLPFFAQYTQSVAGWSPDSTAFAFAGTVGGERGVWVQLVDERVQPWRVAPGDFVTWGRGVTPAAGGTPSAA